MRSRIIFISIMAVILFTLPALGAEVVRFKSGTALIVDKHRVEGNTVYVTIGSGSEIAFPLSLVDKIEPKERVVGSNDLLFNRQQSSGNTGDDFHGVDAPEGGSWSTGYDSLSKFRPGQTRRDTGENPAVYTVPSAQSSYNPALSKVKVALNPALRRKASMPQNTGETGTAGKQTISVPTRRAGVNKGQVTEIKPKLRDE